VDVGDLGALATNYGLSLATSPSAGASSAAVAAPLSMVAGAASSAAVPEPASLAVIGIGAIGVLSGGRRRRRAN
jgi:threonine dehydrogenase-like Zn-dependent dehydrogenase